MSQVSPDVCYGLQRQWYVRLISCDKCTSVVGDIDNGEVVRVQELEAYEKYLCLLLKYAVNLECSKNKSLFKHKD
jgi:hypothetical protein